MRKELGKIRDISAGFGGYQEVQFGFSLSFDMGSSFVTGPFKGHWGNKATDGCEWDDDDRITSYGEAMEEMRLLMVEAKVKQFSDLEGVPVEITMNGNMFVSFRVLTEVL